MNNVLSINESMLLDVSFDDPNTEMLNQVLSVQRKAFQKEPYPSIQQRKDKLKRLRAAVVEHQYKLTAAMSDDYQGRSQTESRLTDILGTVLEINHAISKLRKWMKPEKRQTELLFFSNSSWVEYQPKGVVGVIAPWNFPIFLSLGPLIAALAAGNRVMIKMSEFTPATTSAFRACLADVFSEDEVAVFGGPVEVSKAFSALPFDHLIFTGSTTVGRQVMKAAADNLVPVTLELGGKSPAIVSRSAKLKDAAAKITHGKSLNCGQVCISPDYALVPEESLDSFIEEVKTYYRSMYPDMAVNSPDYSCIITERHTDRLLGLLEDAKQEGARVISCDGPHQGKRIPLNLVVGLTDKMKLAKEEIFGPILIVETYQNIDDVIQYIVDRPRPLAMYYFGHDSAESKKIRRYTHAGGMVINDWAWHVMQSDLPFGGVGESGMGSYHGVEGFRSLSHGKSVFKEQRLFPIGLFHPPYGNIVQKLSLGLYLGYKKH
jgi:coniferyl-aldehyde dehydrogenase